MREASKRKVRLTKKQRNFALLGGGLATVALSKAHPLRKLKRLKGLFKRKPPTVGWVRS